MNIIYKLSGTKTIKKLSVRFYHNSLDISTSMEVMLMDDEWDSEKQIAIGNDELNIHLQQLKVDILKSYNKDFCRGELINKQWFQKTIKNSFMRPKSEIGLVSPDYSIYVSDFALYWLKNYAPQWKVSTKKIMGKPAINQYKKFIETLNEYENIIGDKLQLRNTTKKDIEGFIDWLDSENYQTSTIERNIGRLRFFFNRAIELDIQVSKSFKERIYFDLDNDIEVVYLNEQEIKQIIDKDFYYDNELNIAKENFLLGLHTGLRISDFLKLDMSNIKDGNFSLKTKKTQSKVIIPIHPIVAKIIDSNFGNLPPKLSSSDFNKHIKTICQICKIDNVIYGKLFDKEMRRKKIGYFEKYKLISSHVCRRSFATNNYEKVSKEVLNAICGWSKKSNQSEHYNKTSKLEYAEIMRSKFNNEN